MSHIERGVGLGSAAGGGGGGGGGSLRAEDEDASADADADADVDVDADGPASALVAPVRNGRSKASLSLETFLGPNPGSRASCAVSACAIFAKLCALSYS